MATNQQSHRSNHANVPTHPLVGGLALAGVATMLGYLFWPSSNVKEGPIQEAKPSSTTTTTREKRAGQERSSTTSVQTSKGDGASEDEPRAAEVGQYALAALPNDEASRLTEKCMSLPRNRTKTEVLDGLHRFKQHHFSKSLVPSMELLPELVRLCSDANHLVFQQTPFKVQVYCIMNLLLPFCREIEPGGRRRGAFGQVFTGEGKSIIVRMAAAALVLLGRTVHCMSSSTLLLKRDYDVARVYFDFLGVQTVCIVNRFGGQAIDDATTRASIIFGTANCFEFYNLFRKQHMLHTSDKANGLELVCDIALIDEVDDLLLDKYEHQCIIADKPEEKVDLPTLDQLREIHEIGKAHGHSLTEMVIQAGQSPTLTSNLSKETIKLYCESCMTANKLKKENVHYVVQPNGQYLDEGIVDPSAYLRERWRSLRGDKEELNRLGAVIVDHERTGELSPNTSWEDGVQQFVELKHSIAKLSSLSVHIAKSNHCCYLQSYQGILGITGTLGTEQEQSELRQTYDVKTFQVPRRLLCQRKYEGIVALDEQTFGQTIIRKLHAKSKENRPVLVVCPTIADAKKLFLVLARHFTLSKLQILTGENFSSTKRGFETKAGTHGMITITTSIGGRGIDIQPDRISLLNGGLHVLLTFYPPSQRVEEQILGRAGRQGQPGSGEIVCQIAKGTITGDAYLQRCTSDRFASLHEAIRHRYTSYARERLLYQQQNRWFEALREFYDVRMNRVTGPVLAHKQSKCIEWALLLDKAIFLTTFDPITQRPAFRLDDGTLRELDACIRSLHSDCPAPVNRHY